MTLCINNSFRGKMARVTLKLLFCSRGGHSSKERTRVVIHEPNFELMRVLVDVLTTYRVDSFKII